MKMKRFAFAKKYLNWSEKQWMDAMFSDDYTFRIVNSRNVTVRRVKKPWTSTRGQVHHPQRQALGQCHGLGLLQWKSWQGTPVLSAQERHHEW
jgi:hypothetical protein